MTNQNGKMGITFFQKPIVIALLCVVAILLLFAHVRLHYYAYDDAYIHFRIANHLVDYGTPYFNLGEPVNASSSTGWIIILAFIIIFSKMVHIPLDLPMVVAVFNAMLTFYGALIYTLLFIRLTHKYKRRVLYGLFFVLYLAMIVQPSIGLMEIPLTLLLVGIALHLLLDNNCVCIILFAAAVFFRLELAVLFGLILLLILSLHRYSFRNVLIYSAIGITPFAIYQLYFYQSLLPNTVAVKSIVYSFTFITTLGNIALTLTPNITLPILNYTHPGWFTLFYVVSLFLILAGVVVFQAVSIYKKRDLESGLRFVLVVWGLGLALAYLARNVMIFPWYIPLYGVPILLVLAMLIADSKPGALTVSLSTMIVPLVICQLLSFSQVLLASSGDAADYQEFASGARVRRYIQVGESLRVRYPNAALLSSEIGGLGFGFGGYIIDGVGLVTPSAMKYHPMRVPEERIDGSIGAIPPAFVKEVKPDIIVTYDIFAQALLHSEIIKQYTATEYPVFIATDAAIARELSVWGSRHFFMFIRNDLTDVNVAP